jgi:hypothetical protein
MIRKHVVLLWYYDLFTRFLNRGDARLMVIGYGFGDEHINEAIRQAGRTAKLKCIFLLDPVGRAILNKSSHLPVKVHDDLEDVPSLGGSTRTLSRIFGGDTIVIGRRQVCGRQRCSKPPEATCTLSPVASARRMGWPRGAPPGMSRLARRRTGTRVHANIGARCGHPHLPGCRPIEGDQFASMERRVDPVLARSRRQGPIFQWRRFLGGNAVDARQLPQKRRFIPLEAENPTLC